MSTRSNTIVRDQITGEQIILYRHHDGYLSGAGFDLLEYVRKMTTQKIPVNVKDVSDWILDNGDGYESTDGLHGDIEYLYTLELNGEVLMFVRVNEANGPVIEKDLTAQLEAEYQKENGKLPYQNYILDSCCKDDDRDKLHNLIDELPYEKCKIVYEFLKKMICE